MIDVLIYGLIYPHAARDYGIESGVTDVEFANILAEAGGKDIRLRINSNGGDANAGFAMVSQIKDYPGKISGMVDALAASVAGVLLQATSPRIMASNSAILVHHAHMTIFGGFNSAELKDMGEELANCDDRQAIVFAEAMKKEPAEVMQMFDGEVSLKAHDAVEMGLADSIVGDVKVRADRPKNLNKTPPVWLERRFREYVDVDRPVNAEAVFEKMSHLMQRNQAKDLLTSG